MIFLIIFLLYYHQSAQRQITAQGHGSRLFCKYKNPQNYQYSSHFSLISKNESMPVHAQKICSEHRVWFLVVFRFICAAVSSLRDYFSIPCSTMFKAHSRLHAL